MIGAPLVDVLLSSYRGAAYLDDQIESILAQTWADLSLSIRDDGSNDRTVDRLRARADAPRIRVELGANLGTFASFFRLLAQADPRASFYAFSDQDDHWLPEKIEAAVNRLAAERDDGTALLYCSRQFITDPDLNVVGLTPLWPRAPDWRNALAENVATGCTIVMNQAARNLLVCVPPPRNVAAHDWWCYLVVSSFGRVVFDPTPRILYRQHGANSLGVGSTGLARLARKLRRTRSVDPVLNIRRQAAEFRRLYGPRLSSEQAATLDRLARPGALGARMRLAMRPDIWRQSAAESLALRAMLLAARGHDAGPNSEA